MNIKKILIATHGTLSDGFKNTLELVTGPQNDLISMSFYGDHQNFDYEISNFFEDLDENDQLIICTDIQFGSVNQLFTKESLKFKEKNVLIVSGINLPLLLEIVVRPGTLTILELEDMVQKAKEQITIVDIKNFETKLEEDFF